MYVRKWPTLLPLSIGYSSATVSTVSFIDVIGAL